MSALDTPTLFDVLFEQPLDGVASPVRECGGSRTCCIVIDALDECATADDARNYMLAVIKAKFQRLPPWLHLVVTTRPETDIKQQLRRFRPHVLQAVDARNYGDVEIFLREKLPPLLAHPSPARHPPASPRPSRAPSFLAQLAPLARWRCARR